MTMVGGRGTGRIVVRRPRYTGPRRFTKRPEVSDTDTSKRLAGVGGRDGRCSRDEVICAVREIGEKEKGPRYSGVRELAILSADSNRDFRLRAERTRRHL